MKPQLSTAGLAVLLVVDAVLVGLALQPSHHLSEATTRGRPEADQLPDLTRADAGAVSLSTPPTAGWLAVGNEAWVAGADLRRWKKV